MDELTKLLKRFLIKTDEIYKTTKNINKQLVEQGVGCISYPDLGESWEKEIRLWRDLDEILIYRGRKVDRICMSLNYRVKPNKDSGYCQGYIDVNLYRNRTSGYNMTLERTFWDNKRGDSVIDNEVKELPDGKLKQAIQDMKDEMKNRIRSKMENIVSDRLKRYIAVTQ